MPTSHRRPANKHSKHKTRRRKTQHQLLRGMLFVFAVLMLGFGLFLWKAALELNAPAEPAVSASEDDFRPVVGDPPYRVAIDAGHGGSDPGARGVVEEKQITAATALRHPALNAIRQCPGAHGIRRAFILPGCWQVECRASAQSCADVGECVTFIIWKTTRNSWWRTPTHRYGLSAALRCWKMWIARQYYQNSAL